MNKPLKVFVITVISLVILVVGVSTVISVFYEKALIRYMKNYLDEHLLTELSMDEIRFRFLKGFPHATIEISNAVLLSGNDFSAGDFGESYADTLLKAESIMLQFDLIRLVRKEYELKKIGLSGGYINLLFDSRNRHNLNIWKIADRKGEQYNINLRNIEIGNTHIRVKSLKNKFDLAATAGKVNFKGSFDANVLSGETKGDLRISSLFMKEKKVIQRASLQMALNLVYSSNRLRISNGRLQLNKAEASIEGEYKGGKGSSIDLSVDMPKFGLEELMSIIPSGTRLSAGKYTFSGNGRLHLTLQGPLDNRDQLLVNSTFELHDCTARNTDSRSSVSHLNLHGTITGTQADNFMLKVDTLSARLGKGSFHGTFSLTNLNTLTFSTRLHAQLDLKEIREFAAPDTIEKMHGMLFADFQASGSLKRLTDSTAHALDFIETGKFALEDAGIKLKNLPIQFEHINGKARWGTTIRLDSIALRMNETDLLVSGEIQNLTDYLLNHGSLKSKLKITTNYLNINKYLKQPSNNNSVTGYKSLSVFPDRIHLKAEVNAAQFIAGKFEASDVSIHLSALKDSVYLDDISMRFPDGSITGFALITTDADRAFSMTCYAQPKKINIRQLFYAFNNFSQHFILDKNMKGMLSGAMNFYARWDSTLKLMPSSMKAKGEFEISNGELVQFEPMLKLSKYINVEELRHIRFKTLKNTIYISGRMVNIPEMAINSTAFNISVSGQHSFDNLFNYRMKVLLSEVLFNKARKKKKEINEFMIEESPEDQTTIPLVVAGTPDSFDVKLDRRKAFNLTRSKIKNDPSPGTVKKNPDNFEVEWEEPEKTRPGKRSDSITKQQDIVVEWEE